VSMVGSVNDYQKELQFRKLNAEKDSINIKVIRDGKEQLVPNTDLVVGDVMVLDTGDKVVADGVEIEGHALVIDEASLTGESDPIKKLPDGDFWIRSGSQVRIFAIVV
jgi:P-type Ca2+ transporter type 2C